jgi:hypothetical protein
MKFIIIPLIFLMLFTASCTDTKGLDMVAEKINKLINTNNADDEEKALSELLLNVKDTDINYGYRVFNISKNRSVSQEHLDAELDDELLVTIFVGSEAPYTEFKWKPHYNGHITRLIMP